MENIKKCTTNDLTRSRKHYTVSFQRKQFKTATNKKKIQPKTHLHCKTQI